jgi:hypothetical protein
MKLGSACGKRRDEIKDLYGRGPRRIRNEVVAQGRVVWLRRGSPRRPPLTGRMRQRRSIFQNHNARTLFVALLLLLNLALALILRGLAPAEPLSTDRPGYEYSAQHGLASNCTVGPYCYRVLIPAVLARLPVEREAGWRAVQVIGNTAAGLLIGIVCWQITGAIISPFLAAVLSQLSFGFAHTAWDPYSPDPILFAVGGLVTLLWLKNKPLAVLPLSVIGVFVKETTAVYAIAVALAAIAGRRPNWRTWMLQAVAACGVLFGFHLIMDHFNGWSAGDVRDWLGEGGWLAIWVDRLGAKLALFYVFAPFGLGWLWAAAGYLQADRRLRTLTLGIIVPVAALCYVETVERGLGLAFVVVVPLAVTWLVRVPSWLAVLATLSNGLVTARIGLGSTALLPPAKVVLPLAAIVTAAALCVATTRAWSARDERKEPSGGPQLPVPP